MFQAVCRVCKKPVLRQNYKDHLKDVHKGEDPLDRRQWGDADNRGLFRGLTSSGDKNHNVRRKDGEGNIYRPEAGTDTTGSSTGTIMGMYYVNVYFMETERYSITNRGKN